MNSRKKNSNSFQRILRILRTIFNHLEGDLIIAGFISLCDFRCDHHSNRTVIIFGDNYSPDSTYDHCKYRRSDVLVEYRTECGFSRKFSNGTYDDCMLDTGKGIKMVYIKL